MVKGKIKIIKQCLELPCNNLSDKVKEIEQFMPNHIIPSETFVITTHTPKSFKNNQLTQILTRTSEKKQTAEN